MMKEILASRRAFCLLFLLQSNASTSDAFSVRTGGRSNAVSMPRSSATQRLMANTPINININIGMDMDSTADNGTNAIEMIDDKREEDHSIECTSHDLNLTTDTNSNSSAIFR